MTGWRIGFSFTSPEVSSKFAALQSQVTSNAATPSQVAALAAYSQGDEAQAALDHMGGAFRRRRDLVAARMRELLPGVSFIEPRGAFYLFFRVDSFFDGEVQDATAWCSQLLHERVELGVGNLGGVMDVVTLFVVSDLLAQPLDPFGGSHARFRTARAPCCP